MARVVRFEISADDPERASKFYETVFGWKVTRLEGGRQLYWQCDTGTGSMPGGITKRTNANQRVMNTVEVDDLDDALAKITATGGRVVTPKFTAAGVGQLAFCLDCEENAFGVVQPEKPAK